MPFTDSAELALSKAKATTVGVGGGSVGGGSAGGGSIGGGVVVGGGGAVGRAITWITREVQGSQVTPGSVGNLLQSVAAWHVLGWE